MKQDITSELLHATPSATDGQKREALRILRGDVTVTRPLGGPLLMSVAATAEYLGVSRSTAWRIGRAGRLKKIEIAAGRFRFRRKDIDELVTNA